MTMTFTSTARSTSKNNDLNNEPGIVRKVPDTIVSLEDIKSYFKKDVYGCDYYPLKYKGRECIFERLQWIRSLPKDMEEDLITKTAEKKKIWDVMNSTIYQYYISYAGLSSSAKSRYGFLLREDGSIYFKILLNIKTIKELYLSCFLYFKYNSLLRGEHFSNTVDLLSKKEKIKIDIIGHLTCCELYTSYLIKYKNDRERQILMVSLNPIQEVSIVNKLKKKEIITKSESNVGSFNTNYTLYGFPVILLTLESNKTLYNLMLSFKKGNTLIRTHQVDNYHIFNDIVDSMKIYQKYGVHNGICPENISYNNETDRYYFVSYSSFTKDRLPSGYRRKTFINKWKSQVKRYYCVTHIKYDLLELGFVLNWIEMVKLKLTNSVKMPVTRNMKDYFEYVNELNSDIKINDKIIIDLGKVLRRLDKTLDNRPIC